MRNGIAGWLVVTAVLVGCGRDERPAPSPTSEPANAASAPAPLTVFAAASLRDVATGLSTAFERAGHAPLRFNFAGSNVLAQQIEASSEGDVFLSADERWPDELERGGHVLAGTKRWFLSNTLVIVAHPSTSFALEDPTGLASLGFEHLALADPAAVPAGRYAKAYLESLTTPRGTVWSAVERRVAPAADVRAALALVAADAGTVGIVYRTDARAASVRTLYTVPVDGLPTKVRYVAAAIAGRRNEVEARAFVDFLTSTEARALFADAGFLVPDEAL